MVGVHTDGAADELLIRRRFEDRFERSGSGFEARRVVYEGKYVESSKALEQSHFVERQGELLRAVKRGLGFWLRLFGRGLLFAPLVWVWEWLAGAVGLPLGYGVTSLVVATCVFFGFLNLYIWAAMLEYFRRRRMAIERPFDEEGSDRLGLLPPASQAIVGTIAALAPSRAREVWREAWFDDGDLVRRMAGGDHFVVVPDDGSPPVICRIAAAPLLVGPATREALASPSVRALFPDTIAEGTVDSLAIRVGDAVALHAESLEDLQRVDHVELEKGQVRGYRPGTGADEAPYRGGAGQPGRLARSTPQRPLRIRKLR